MRCAIWMLWGYTAASVTGSITLFEVKKDTQPSQTYSGVFNKTQLCATYCCFFTTGEYNQILVVPLPLNTHNHTNSGSCLSGSSE